MKKILPLFVLLVPLSLLEPPKQKGAEMVTGSAQEIARELVRRIREKTGIF